MAHSRTFDEALASGGGGRARLGQLLAAQSWPYKEIKSWPYKKIMLEIKEIETCVQWKEIQKKCEGKSKRRTEEDCTESTLLRRLGGRNKKTTTQKKATKIPFPHIYEHTGRAVSPTRREGKMKRV